MSVIKSDEVKLRFQAGDFQSFVHNSWMLSPSSWRIIKLFMSCNKFKKKFMNQIQGPLSSISSSREATFMRKKFRELYLFYIWDILEFVTHHIFLIKILKFITIFSPLINSQTQNLLLTLRLAYNWLIQILGTNKFFLCECFFFLF